MSTSIHRSLLVKILSASVVAIISAGSVGCTSLGQIAETGQRLPITVYEGTAELEETGAVYLWPPYSSAAIVDGKGNRCVLAASGAKTIDASTEAALKIAKAFEKIDGLDASMKQTLTETFLKLSAADAHAAFADVALFHLCILDQNGTFKDKNDDHSPNMKGPQILDAYFKTIEAAKSIP